MNVRLYIISSDKCVLAYVSFALPGSHPLSLFQTERKRELIQFDKRNTHVLLWGFSPYSITHLENNYFAVLGLEIKGPC